MISFFFGKRQMISCIKKRIKRALSPHKNDLFVHGLRHVLIRTLEYITGKLVHIYLHVHLVFHPYLDS